MPLLNEDQARWQCRRPFRTSMLLQAPGFQPMKLRLHLSWNKYYQTEALQNAFEHPVDNLQQIPKLTGRDHDTWISCPNLTEDFEDFGNDCYILISRLHPSVDGLQQVDKFDPDQKKLAIRVPLYNDTELNEINQNISTQQPVVQKQHKVNPHLVLNELTVAEFHGLDPNGNTVDQETVAKIFAGIGRLPHRLPLPEQAIPASTLYPFPVLPSTVIDERSASNEGGSISFAFLNSQSSQHARTAHLRDEHKYINARIEKDLKYLKLQVKQHSSEIHNVKTHMNDVSIYIKELDGAGQAA